MLFFLSHTSFLCTDASWVSRPPNSTLAVWTCRFEPWQRERISNEHINLALFSLYWLLTDAGNQISFALTCSQIAANHDHVARTDYWLFFADGRCGQGVAPPLQTHASPRLSSRGKLELMELLRHIYAFNWKGAAHLLQILHGVRALPASSSLLPHRAASALFSLNALWF